MWLALLILSAVGAAVGEENECQAQVYDKCNIAAVKPEIPDTMEDLKRECGNVKDSIKCMDEEAVECKVIKDVFDLTYFKKLAQFIETNCDEEKKLYQVLSKNYECIKPKLKSIDGQCRPSEEEWEDMINMVSKEEEFSGTEKICQRALYEIKCIAHIIGTQCKQEGVKEAVTEILQNIRGDFHYCNEESISSKLQPFKEFFETRFQAPEGENGHA